TYRSSQRTYSHHILHSFPTRRSSDLRHLNNEKTLTEKVSPKKKSRSVKAKREKNGNLKDKDKKRKKEKKSKSKSKEEKKKKKKRSEEHTSDSSHLGISYAVFCLKKKK